MIFFGTYWGRKVKKEREREEEKKVKKSFTLSTQASSQTVHLFLSSSFPEWLRKWFYYIMTFSLNSPLWSSGWWDSKYSKYFLYTVKTYIWGRWLFLWWGKNTPRKLGLHSLKCPEKHIEWLPLIKKESCKCAKQCDYLFFFFFLVSSFPGFKNQISNSNKNY